MALVRTLLEFLMGVFIGSLFVNHKEFLERYRNAALAGFRRPVACCMSAPPCPTTPSSRSHSRS
jgi:hypothetical protein